MSTSIEQLTVKVSEAHSANMLNLWFKLTARKMPHFEIYNMIKEFNFGRLDVQIEVTRRYRYEKKLHEIVVYT